MAKTNLINKVSYYAGAFIVFGSHLAILGMGGLPEGQAITHAILNLFGASLLAYSWFTK